MYNIKSFKIHTVCLMCNFIYVKSVKELHHCTDTIFRGKQYIQVGFCFLPCGTFYKINREQFHCIITILIILKSKYGKSI